MVWHRYCAIGMTLYVAPRRYGEYITPISLKISAILANDMAPKTGIPSASASTVSLRFGTNCFAAHQDLKIDWETTRRGARLTYRDEICVQRHWAQTGNTQAHTPMRISNMP